MRRSPGRREKPHRLKHTNAQGRTHIQILRRRRIHTLAYTLCPPSCEHILWDWFLERGIILQKQIYYLSYAIPPVTHMQRQCKRQHLHSSRTLFPMHHPHPHTPPGNTRRLTTYPSLSTHKLPYYKYTLQCPTERLWPDGDTASAV